MGADFGRARLPNDAPLRSAPITVSVSRMYHAETLAEPFTAQAAKLLSRVDPTGSAGALA
jgi:hypothetical protein